MIVRADIACGRLSRLSPLSSYVPWNFNRVLPKDRSNEESKVRIHLPRAVSELRTRGSGATKIHAVPVDVSAKFGFHQEPMVRIQLCPVASLLRTDFPAGSKGRSVRSRQSPKKGIGALFR